MNQKARPDPHFSIFPSAGAVQSKLLLEGFKAYAKEQASAFAKAGKKFVTRVVAPASSIYGAIQGVECLASCI